MLLHIPPWCRTLVRGHTVGRWSKQLVWQKAAGLCLYDVAKHLI